MDSPNKNKENKNPDPPSFHVPRSSSSGTNRRYVLQRGVRAREKKRK